MNIGGPSCAREIVRSALWHPSAELGLLREDWGGQFCQLYVGHPSVVLPCLPSGNRGQAWGGSERWSPLAHQLKMGLKTKDSIHVPFYDLNEREIHKYQCLDVLNDHNVTNDMFPFDPPAGEHQWLQYELSEALPSRPPHQASASRLHHPYFTLDLRAVL